MAPPVMWPCKPRERHSFPCWRVRNNSPEVFPVHNRDWTWGHWLTGAHTTTPLLLPSNESSSLVLSAMEDKRGTLTWLGSRSTIPSCWTTEALHCHVLDETTFSLPKWSRAVLLDTWSRAPAPTYQNQPVADVATLPPSTVTVADL